MAITGHSRWISRAGLGLAFLLAYAVAPAQEQTFKVLHTFHGSNGMYPASQLVRDADGNIYGTTEGGGSGKCSKVGCGTVFKLNEAGTQVWLHSFKGGNGMEPAAGLLRDKAGNLFGTTVAGGDMNCNPPYGCGTVFKLDKTGTKETALHRFTGTPDGFFPESLLIEDKAGNLYGTAYLGGADSLGSIFKIGTGGKETILHSFAGPIDGGGDGAYSYQGVIRDAAGNLYGVTDAGGAYCCGVVYKVDSMGHETLLYSFTGQADGSGPDSVLVMDAGGNLYGTTKGGGNLACGGGDGCGVIFELSPQSGGGWTETTLYTFCSLSNCDDGQQPGQGPLVLDAAGNLYGTTIFGGTNGDGVVFKLDTAGKQTVLHSFTGGSGGEFPVAGLAMDDSGVLYGTTLQGGATCFTRYTCGVVFKITQ
jgi:uncharacterized repeat protein (TIGR03803 family)